MCRAGWYGVTEADLLPAQIDRFVNVVDELAAKLDTFLSSTLGQMGRTEVAAAYVAPMIGSTYTALETLFLRISQHFENSVAGDRWHADLLDKMTLHVTGVRERVLADETLRLLHELRRFRHFTRYYFDMDYDWARLDYLCDVYRRAIPLVKRDLAGFRTFVEQTLP